MTKSDINVTLARMKREIIEDVVAGKVPATVKSFGDLHNNVDANEYGGFCEDELADSMIAEFGGRDEHEGMPQGMLDFINDAQKRIDEWITEGGIAQDLAAQLNAKVKITEGPWGSSAAMSSDVYNIRYITGADGQNVATIRHDKEMSQEEALANAKAIKATPDLLATLMIIEQELQSHPDFAKGNSKVHFAVHKARSAIAKAI